MKKPSRPHKPIPPPLKIRAVKSEHFVDLKDYCSVGELISSLEGFDKAAKIYFNGYYLEAYDNESYGGVNNLTLKIIETHEINNPDFEKQMKKHALHLTQYKQKLEKYNTELPAYEAWAEEQKVTRLAKEKERMADEIKKLEKKLKSLSK